MPNWCTNNLDLKGSHASLSAFVQESQPINERAAHAALVKTMALLRAGVVTLQNQVETDICFADGTPIASLSVTADACHSKAGVFANWLLQALLQNLPMTRELCHQIVEGYKSSGIYNMLWSNLPRPQRRIIGKVLTGCSFDILSSKGWKTQAERLWIALDGLAYSKTPSSQPRLCFEAFCPIGLIALANGFNGNLFKNELSEYGANIERFGTKWNSDEIWFDDFDERRVSLSIRFDTAWSPTIPVAEAIARRFPDLNVELTYIEEGMSFCGRVLFEDGDLVLSEDDQLEYDNCDCNEEDADNGYSSLVGPHYLCEAGLI
jgi:hypothetical protein